MQVQGLMRVLSFAEVIWCVKSRVALVSDNAQGGCVPNTCSVRTEDYLHLVGVYLGAYLGGALIVIVIVAVTRQGSSVDDLQ
jgi:hypothetical protein